MNVLRSQVKKKNSQYFDISDLYYIPRDTNEDVLETGILINPIVVYRIVYENYSKDGPPRYGVGGAPYIPGCLGKTNTISHPGDLLKRFPATLFINNSFLNHQFVFTSPENNGGF